MSEFITEQRASQLLNASESASSEALNAYKEALDAVETARMGLYEERASESGDSIFVPIKKLAQELLDSADVPADAMPGGRGGDAKERAAARHRWCMNNIRLYREYMEQIDDAEFKISIAEGRLAAAERQTARENSRYGAVTAMLNFLTAGLNYSAACKTMQAAKPAFPTGKKIETPPECHQSVGLSLRLPQEVDDNLF